MQQPSIKDCLNLKLSCVKYSLDNEQAKTNYAKVLKNQKGINVVSYSKKKYIEDQARKQKSSCLVEIATEHNLIGVFITVTLDSEYHYLIDGKYKNDKFAFSSIDEAIQKGYDKLKDFFRLFYQNTKRQNKNMLYIACFEPHKSLVPHLHILIFIEPQELEAIEKIFNRNIKHCALGRNEFVVLNANAKLAGYYLTKYIFKNLDNADNTNNRLYDGYYKKFKIRAFRMSQLPLTLELYKKIYHSLDKEYKENLVKELNGKKSIFSFIMNNIKIEKTYFDQNLDFITNKAFGVLSYDFKVSIHYQKINCFRTNQSKNKIIHYKVVQTIDNEPNTIYTKLSSQELQRRKIESFIEYLETSLSKENES